MEVSVCIDDIVNVTVAAIAAVAARCCTAASSRANAISSACCFTFSAATELALFAAAAAFFTRSIVASTISFVRVAVSNSWWAALFFHPPVAGINALPRYIELTPPFEIDGVGRLHVHALIVNAYDCYHVGTTSLGV